MKRRDTVTSMISVGSWAMTVAALAVVSTPAAAEPGKKGAAGTPAEAPSVASVNLAVIVAKCGSTPAATCGYPTAAGSVFDGFRWGMSHVDVAELYNKTAGILDREYNADLSRVSPGREMTALEHERDDRKRAVESAYIVFGNVPTGYDATALKGEYSYRNKESITTVEVRGGGKRHFFYLGNAPADRLWKIYEEIPLTENHPLGKNFKEAVARVSASLANPGRMKEASEENNFRATADWQDDRTHLRVLERGTDSAKRPVVAIILEERQTLQALPQIRSTKAADPFALDPSVAQITSGSISDPNATRDAGAPDAATGKKKR